MHQITPTVSFSLCEHQVDNPTTMNTESSSSDSAPASAPSLAVVPAQGNGQFVQTAVLVSSPASDEGHECATPFQSTQFQIYVEFGYLLVTLILAVALTIVVAAYVTGATRPLFLAALGGFLGGWTFDAKWFYRVTARGKDDQHEQTWQKHKFYWRILIPFVAGLISFATYSLASSGSMPIHIADPKSGRVAFGFAYFVGLFMDVLLSRIAKWVEHM